MKKVIVVIIIIFVIGVVFMFINKVFSDREISKPKNLEITYKINAGIPFRWEYEIEDKSVVKFVKSYVIKDENKGSIVGAPVYTNYVFEGLKEGTTTITFKYVNFADNYISSEDKYIVKVDKDKNIKLVDKNIE